MDESIPSWRGQVGHIDTTAGKIKDGAKVVVSSATKSLDGARETQATSTRPLKRRRLSSVERSVAAEAEKTRSFKLSSAPPKEATDSITAFHTPAISDTDFTIEEEKDDNRPGKRSPYPRGGRTQTDVEQVPEEECKAIKTSAVLCDRPNKREGEPAYCTCAKCRVDQHCTCARSLTEEDDHWKEPPCNTCPTARATKSDSSIEKAALEAELLSNIVNAARTQAAAIRDAKLRHFISTMLWREYCLLSSSATASTFCQLTDMQYVEAEGKAIPIHPAPQAWVEEVFYRIRKMLDKTGARNIVAVTGVRGEMFSLHHWDDLRRGLAELALLTKYDVYRGRNEELGVFAEIIGLVPMGTFWKG